MPEYIRALVFILVLTVVVFKFAETPATTTTMARADFIIRRNSWIFITLAGFLSQSVWVFYLVSAYIVYKAAKKDSNRVALFFFLILAMPELMSFVPGVAGINYIIAVTYQRMLVWVLLLPIFWKMLFGKNLEKNEWNSVDIALIIYTALNMVLQFQYLVVTEWVRYALGWMSDILIPYFVISRSIKDIKIFKDVII